MMSQSFRVKTKRTADYRVSLPVSSESLYVRPSSADGGSSKRSKPSKRHHSSSSKPGIRKLAKRFLRSSKDDDIKALKIKIPPGFHEEYSSPHRSLSPDSPFQRNRYYSVGSRGALKIKLIGKDKDEPFFMWKPCKRKCEWESMSGRQLTIGNAAITELTKVELDQIQRVAVARLQGMDISVSFGLLKGRVGKLGKLSTSMRRKISNDRPVSTAVFGQPLTAVIDNETRTRVATVSSPTNTSPPIAPPPYSLSPPSSTFQSHPDQPIASAVDEDGVELSLPFLDQEMSADATKSSPLSPRHDSFHHSSDHLVPLIVRKAIHYLDNNGIKTEGIFRVPGAKARIDEIRRQFDKGEDVEIPEDANPHDVACLFKEFFRSLPEPLMTKELYYPLLQTRQLQSRFQQKEALQLICLLLPRPNRDTLQELVQFLSRVALHSNDTILLDGTEEAGNKMTSQNLAMVLGPNIIHNESKRKNVQAAYQVTKADPEELTAVCNVMEDLIVLHDDVFKVSADLYDTALRNLFLSDHETVDTILKRKCEGPLDADGHMSSARFVEPSLCDVSRSKSSDCLRQKPVSSLMVDDDDEDDDHEGGTTRAVWHQRTRSLSDSLDALLKNIEEMLSEKADPSEHRRHSSNDSAMGESECITSPCQHHAHDIHNPSLSMYNSVDSAISNHSSSHHFSSCEGMAYSTGDHSSNSNYTLNTPLPAHVRMPSEMSVQSESPFPSQSSPVRVNSPKFVPKSSPYYRGSLPVLTPDQDSILHRRSSSPFSFIRKLRKSSSTNSGKRTWNKKRRLNKNTPMGSLDDNMPEYQLQRSPLLGGRKFNWERTDSNDTRAEAEELLEVMSDQSLQDITPRFNFVIQPASEVLI